MSKKKEGWTEVQISLSSEAFINLAMEAHRLDITFNDHVNRILRKKVQEKTG